MYDLNGNKNIDYSGDLEKLMNDDDFIRALNHVYYKMYLYKYRDMKFAVYMN